MIQKLLCLLLGHKTVYSAFTGQIARVDTAFVRNVATPVYTLERSDFCRRCGTRVHYDKQSSEDVEDGS